MVSSKESSKDPRLVARVCLILAIIAMIVADVFEQPLVVRITALVIIAASGSYLTYFYLPHGIRIFFSKIINVIFILFVVGTIIYSLLTARNKIWLYSFIFYIVVSVAAYVIRYIHLQKSLAIGSCKKDLTCLGIWCTATVFVWGNSYCLYESPSTKSIMLLILVQIPGLILAVNYWFRSGSIISRVGYGIVCLSLLLYGAIHYLPVDNIVQWKLFCVSATLSIISILFLSYICIKDIPSMESFLALICILFIIGGVSACTELPEIKCQLQPFFNM